MTRWAELRETPFGSRHWQTSEPSAQMPLGRYYPSATLLSDEQLDAAAILAQMLDNPDLGYDTAEAIRHVLTAVGCYPVHPYNAIA